MHFLPTIFLEIAVCRAQFLSKVSSYCPFCDKQLSAAVCINCGSQHHYATVNKYKKFWDHIYTIKKIKEYIPKKVSYNEICCGYCEKNNMQIISNQLNKVFMLFDEIKEIRAPLKTPAWEASIGFN